MKKKLLFLLIACCSVLYSNGQCEIPTGPTPQVFTPGFTLADLELNETDINWFASATGGTAFATSQELVDGTTYYAELTCANPTGRLAVVVRKISEATQSFCTEDTASNNKTIADLIATPTSGYTANWYAAETGGTALASTTNINRGDTYYVAQEGLQVSTLAGGISNGYVDGTGTAAKFTYPVGIIKDSIGNFYIADDGNNRIRKITPSGLVSTFAGSGGGYLDGAAAVAKFNSPTGIVIDTANNFYVTDSDNHLIRKITPEGIVSTFAGAGSRGFADGTGTAAQFYNPHGLTIDTANNLYVTDKKNHRIRKITPEGVVSTFAGSTYGTADGTGTSAQISSPKGITIDSTGNLYVTDSQNRIRKITPEGVVSTFAGSSYGNIDGTGIAAKFNGPDGITIDTENNLYVTDRNNHSIRKITQAGVVSTVTGDSRGYVDGAGITARFSGPSGISIDGSGNIYVVDFSNHSIRKISGVASNRVKVTIAKEPVAPIAATQSFCYGATVSELVATGVTDATFKWYSEAAGGTALATTALLTFGTYYVSQTGANACESARTSVSINVSKATPTGNNLQVFASGQTLANLKLNETNIVWYAAQAGGTALEASQELAAGTYYAALAATEDCPETTGRLAVTAHKIYEASQSICADDTTSSGKTIADLIATPTSGYTANWYAAETGGTALASSTALASGTYYVAQEGTVVSTFVGGGTYGSADGTGTSAQFRGPHGLTLDTENNLYVTDYDNHRIRKITPAGVVSTFAGSNRGYLEGTGTAAQFNRPRGIVIDTDNNLYVTDSGNHCIRKITPEGVVSTFVGGTYGSEDGTGTSAQFRSPQGLTIDTANNLYAADTDNQRIRKITPAGVVSTVAGSSNGYLDGTGTSAQFRSPQGLTIDTANNLYVADANNHGIRKITPAGEVSTVAGSSAGYLDGTGTSAQFRNPNDVAIDAAGNLFVTDKTNHKIRKITPEGVVSTVAGSSRGNTDGIGTSAKFSSPYGITIDGMGNLYVADFNNQRIRRISTIASNRVKVTIAKQPVAPIAATQSFCYGATVSELVATGVTDATFKWYSETTGGTALATTALLTSGTYYVSQTGANACESARTSVSINISKATPTGDNLQVFAPGQTLANLKLNETNIVWYAAQTGGTALEASQELAAGTYYAALAATEDCPETTGRLAVTAHKISEASQSICADDTTSSNKTIADLIATPTSGYTANWYAAETGGTALASSTALASGTYYVAQEGAVVSTFVGNTSGALDGIGTDALFNRPTGLSIDNIGNIFIADYYNHRIRKITPAGVVSTFAGSSYGYLDGTGTGAQFNRPTSITIDAANNLYVADADNNRIRKITPAGVVSTVAGSSRGYLDGTGITAKFHTPTNVAIDDEGNLFVIDQTNNRIRKITPEGVVSTFAGSFRGNTNGAGTAAKFSFPYGITIDSTGNFYVTDYANHRIRKISAASSSRVAVKVDISDSPAAVPTGESTQSFVLGKTVGDIAVTGINVKWYASETSTTPLATSTMLTHNTTYYATQANVCGESTTRMAVLALVPLLEVIEDIKGNANNTPATAAELNSIAGVTGAEVGVDYTAALAAGTFVNKNTPTAEEIQAVVTAVNEAVTEAMNEVVEDIQGNANNIPATAAELNSIAGVTGAEAGVDYTAALAAGTFVNKNTPTAEEIQAVVTAVNEAVTEAMNEVVEDIQGNANNIPATAAELNSFAGISGAEVGVDYTAALAAGTFVDENTPTAEEIQAVVTNVNEAVTEAMNEVVEDIQGNANNIPATAAELNSIAGVTGAEAGVDYTEALAAGTFVNKNTPTAEEIQAVVTNVNEAVTEAMNEVVEDIQGNANNIPATAAELNSIAGVTGAEAGVDYTEALAAGTFVNKNTPTAEEIQAVVTNVNEAVTEAMNEVVEDIQGNANNIPATAAELNSIVGISGAEVGVDYTAALAAGTFVDENTPTAEEIQAVVANVNEAVTEAMNEVVEDIQGNANNTPATAAELNSIVGISGAEVGVDYTAALTAGTFVDENNPTAEEIQAVVTNVNEAVTEAMNEVVEDIQGNANNTPATAAELNSIVGISGAEVGVDYTAALAAGTFVDENNPTAEEIQAVVTNVNEAVTEAMNEVVEDIQGNANNTPATAAELNCIVGISGAEVGVDYTAALAAGIYANKNNPTTEEIQTVINNRNRALSVAVFNNLEVSTYPNPTSNFINIKANDTITKVVVYNLVGQEVLNQQVNNSNVSINLEALESAVYLVRIATNDKSQIIRVVKK